MTMVRVRASHALRPSRVKPLFNRKSAVFRHTMGIGIKISNAAKVRLGRAPKRIDTGRLRASIKVSTFTSSTWSTPGVRVGTNVEYAVYVHEGTRYMQKNPFITDAVASVMR
jgi:hypothetical protein